MNNNAGHGEEHIDGEEGHGNGVEDDGKLEAAEGYHGDYGVHDACDAEDVTVALCHAVYLRVFHLVLYES